MPRSRVCSAAVAHQGPRRRMAMYSKNDNVPPGFSSSVIAAEQLLDVGHR